MRSRLVLAAAITIFAGAPVSAQALQDAQSWTAQTGTAGETSVLRWNFSTEEAAPAISIISSDSVLETDVTAVTGQVDFFPFGDEFYLSAGAVRPVETSDAAAWALSSSTPAWAGFPHTELVQPGDETRIEALTRYLGAGITVRNIDQWSLTIEGGAYFQDRGRDRLQILDPDTGETMTLLEDLDNVDRAAVGDSQARSIRPVGHLVIRRRF